MFLRVVILVFAATCCTALEINVTAKQSAWEQSGKFEGDIMLTEEQMRIGIINPARRWPKGSVPYVIDSVFSTVQRNIILGAIVDFHQRTPIIFTEYNPWNDTDYVNITGEDTGCWSFIGRTGGRQELNLQRNRCLWHGIVIHELLHALGFWHMHGATERDDYVTINRQNIEPGYQSNFDRLSAIIITSFGVPYDYGSVMHYGRYAFSRNGLTTIEPHDPNATIGQIDGFSEKDIERVARMYETLYETSTSYTTAPDNSSHATPSLFLTLIIITLNICTQIQ